LFAFIDFILLLILCGGVRSTLPNKRDETANLYRYSPAEGEITRLAYQ